MSDSQGIFGPASGEELLDLLNEYPLAWLTTGAADAFQATLLPLLPVVSPAGKLTGMCGHIPRGNPQFDALQRDARATVLLLGPHGYISPSWMKDRSQAPTWNYASAQCLVEIEFLEDAAALAAHLEALVDTMESDRTGRWHIPEMGGRYEQLARRIVCFVAHIRTAREKYKLGQDERADVYADIVRGLSAEGRNDLLKWMRRMNLRRPEAG